VPRVSPAFSLVFITVLEGVVFSPATHGTEWLVIATYPELHAEMGCGQRINPVPTLL
jgi:hypothetical protein